jgi:hypothetical protein
MPQFDLRRLFQCVSLLAAALGIAALLARLEEASLGPWVIVPVIAILFLLGAAVGSLFGRTRRGGFIALLVTLPWMFVMWIVVMKLGEGVA